MRFDAKAVQFNIGGTVSLSSSLEFVTLAWRIFSDNILNMGSKTMVETLARQLRRQRYCRDLLYRGQAEQSYTATHTASGVGVKLRPDLLVRSRAGRQLTLIDFKTTSAPDLARFLATIEKYDYDRQAALYLDVLGATRFLIIGVQKRVPHAVWRVELTAMPSLLAQGRKKYTALLRHHARQYINVAPATYSPS